VRRNAHISAVKKATLRWASWLSRPTAVDGAPATDRLTFPDAIELESLKHPEQPEQPQLQLQPQLQSQPDLEPEPEPEPDLELEPLGDALERVQLEQILAATAAFPDPDQQDQPDQIISKL